MEELENNDILKDFIGFITGEEFGTLSGFMNTLKRRDLKWFLEELEITEDESFKSYKAEWTSLVKVLMEPGVFEACEAQRSQLIKDKKLL